MKHLNQANFDAEMGKTRFALILFGAQYCPPCKLIKAKLEALETKHTYYVDMDESPMLTRQMYITSVPTVIGTIDRERVVESPGGMRTSLIREFEGMCREALEG